MLNLETMDTSVLVAVISAIVSISAAIISLCGIRHHEIVTSMTKSRITWIKDVRELITDFCIQFYFLPNEKASFELIARRNALNYGYKKSKVIFSDSPEKVMENIS